MSSEISNKSEPEDDAYSVSTVTSDNELIVTDVEVGNISVLTIKNKYRFKMPNANELGTLEETNAFVSVEEAMKAVANRYYTLLEYEDVNNLSEGQFKCVACWTVFNTHSLYIKHIATCPSECKKCGQLFQTKWEAFEHCSDTPGGQGMPNKFLEQLQNLPD